MQGIWYTAVFLYFVWNLSFTSAFIGVIAPGKIRLGTDQKIFLLGLGLGDNDRDYTVTISPGNRQSHTFYRQTHTVQNGVLTTININVDPSDIVPESTRDITLRVRSTQQGGFDRSENIELDESPGYLFVQIDKPIYTSRQTVKYRVIAVDEDLKWAAWPVQISLLNPRDHLIDRVTESARDAFTGAEFSLSRNPMKGKWKIRASYTNFSTDSIANFEVRDYTLPRFGVKVKCNSTSVYTENTSPLKVSVKAEYVYGEPVHGRLSLTLFARAWEYEVIYDRLQYQLDNSGKVEIIFNDEEIMDHGIMSDLPVELYVAINVTEDGTDIVLKKEFKVATFADYPFTLSVINKKEYYQPGFPYILELEAEKPDGKIAKNAAVDIEITGQEPATLRTNNKGRITREIPTPENGTPIQIEYSPEGLSDHEHEFTVYPVAASPVESQNNQYIKVSAQQRPSLNRGLPVSVSYTSPPGLYFIMVASRGQVVYQESFTSGTNGVEVRTIPREVLKYMVPSARILVFYVANDHVVADSLLVDMGSSCREELSLSKVGDSQDYKPKDTGQIRIRGGPSMTVGLVAVDKGVFALKYEKSITRKKMFDSLGSHDFGKKSGDGGNCVEIFESAGFTLMYEGDHLWPISGNEHGRGRSDWPDEENGNAVLRSFFPESWMFQEETLNSEGESIIDVTYPDSITTWVMYAVGVSQEKGICVSPVEKVLVTKNFFIDLDIPFKAVRLEEINVKVTVSNYLGYDTGVTLNATAGGLCTLNEAMLYEFSVPNGGKVTKMFNLLPVNAGSFVVRTAVVTESGLDKDAIEKKMIVMCEGQPTTKSIAFSLDPTGEPRNDLTVRQTVNQNIQNTRVNMAFPKEAIPESEKIQITASGDLLGDVIGNFVLGSHFPSDIAGVESLMMKLAPSCYGLQYLAQLDSLSPEVLHKGRKHIRYGLTELLKYRTEEGAFALEEIHPDDFDVDTSTWFTSFVLKTLCAAKSILVIDEDIIHTGYTWLLSQVTGSRSQGFTVQENDAREIPEEGEHVMAEILLSSYSCSHQMTHETATNRDSIKQWYIYNQRSEYNSHQTSLTLAKVTYTLLNLDEDDNAWRSAARTLRSRKRSSDGYIYWSDEQLEDEEVPMVYTTKPTSETIETTAYALLVFVKVNMKYGCHHRRLRSRPCRRLYVEPDKIADWLLLWRNGNGLFVSATDTAIAIEALAKFRESKRISQTHLNVSLSTSPNEIFKHNLVFGEEDVFQPQTLPHVPLGQQLHVQTTGSGLGHMHVDATYNTPIDVNADCRFNITAQPYPQNFDSIREGRTDLCSVCGTRLTCPKGDNFVCQGDSTRSTIRGSSTYCLKVCMRYNSRNDHGKLFIKVRMLSGYVPNECDLQELEGDRVVKASYDDEEDFVHIHLKRVSATEEECVGFRINKIRHVFRIKPALVTVRSFNVEEWTCPREYTALDDAASAMPVYCSTQVQNQYRGCTCINDACVKCNLPGRSQGLAFYRKRGRQSSYVFKLRAVSSGDQNGTRARHLVFDVEEVVKSCLGNFTFEHRQVTFVTKKECGSIFNEEATYWVMGSDYNTYTDPMGNTEHHFFLNNATFLLSSSRVEPEVFNRESAEIRMAMRRESGGCP